MTGADVAAAPADAPTIRTADDAAMIRTAAELTRDLVVPNARIYWADCLASVALGYGGMAVAIAGVMGAVPGLLAIAGAIIAIIALYRAGSFIHELTHMKRAAVPGFWAAWNLLVGVPLLVPSFMYEGVHNLHHQRLRYGTASDPEYLPLALMKPYTLPLFVAIAALGPVGLLVRYGVLAPLSLVVPPLRRVVVARYSGLVINPAFRRRPAEGAARREWLVLESAASLWAIAIIAAVVGGIIPMPAFLTALAIASGTMMLNQLRTLVAHLWENDGEVMSVTAQYLDSVNVPPPGLLPALWAPVGLRYHALHHLLPGVPYHALGQAHRRIASALGRHSTYDRANYAGLSPLVHKIVTSSVARGS
ncbi:MAG: fatty acid desaturase family protein [Sphingopyxis sp.]